MLAQWLFPTFFAIVVNARDMPGGLLLVDQFAPISSNATNSTPSLNVFGLSNDRVITRKTLGNFNNGGYSVLPRDPRISRLFARAPCVDGFSPCSNDPSICCPSGGKCCIDGSCCSSRSNCVFVTGQTKLACCPTGTQCPGTSPCRDAGYAPCPNDTFCCPTRYTCFRDSTGAPKCGVPNSPFLSSTVTHLPPPTPTFASTFSPISSDSSPISPDPINLDSNSTPVGAIVGGVVGGVAVLALLIIGALLYLRKRQSLQNQTLLRSQDFVPQMQPVQPGPVGFAAGGFNPGDVLQRDSLPSPHPSSPGLSPTTPGPTPAILGLHSGGSETHEDTTSSAYGGIYRSSPTAPTAPVDPFDGPQIAQPRPYYYDAPNLTPIAEMSTRASAQEFYPNTPGHTASFFGGGSTQNPTPVSALFATVDEGPASQPFLPQGRGTPGEN